MPVGGAAPRTFVPGGINPRAATDFRQRLLGVWLGVERSVIDDAIA